LMLKFDFLISQIRVHKWVSLYRYTEERRRHDALLAEARREHQCPPLPAFFSPLTPSHSPVGLYKLNAVGPQLERRLVSTLEPIK
jgi:hypothetical protein